jgi:L-asparaginase / beta-aspartyl-peptidase
MPAGRELMYREALKGHLMAGWAVLEGGGSALDAVEAAVRSLEDDILFNAGRGAVFTRDATHELDASIMCGRTLYCGAVAGVQRVRNPITLARAIMERSEHVMMMGEGARRFAEEAGIEFADDDYFYSQDRFEQLEVARAALRVQLDHAPEEPLPGETTHPDSTGTVGAVALDDAGDLAAATSTGGMTNKRVGRVGDTPIIGAGTYANNATCAVSCTGHGELIMKAIAAYDVSALMEYAGRSLAEACDIVINRKLASEHGTAGLIAVDRDGTIALPFNSSGMYRAAISSTSELIVSIW